MSVVVNPLKHQCGMQIYKNPSLVYRTGFIDASKCDYTLKESPLECLCKGGWMCQRPGIVLKKFEQYLDHTSRSHFQVYCGEIVIFPKESHQKPSKNIKRHQKTSKDIERHRKTSKDIERLQKTSKDIKRHQKTLKDIERHRKTLKDIELHQMTSKSPSN